MNLLVTEDDGKQWVEAVRCRNCKWWQPTENENVCPCVDYDLFSFKRPWFDSDVCCGNHMICSRFEPSALYRHIKKEWPGYNLYWSLYVRDWLGGQEPSTIPIILRKPLGKGRDVGDDVFYVPFELFRNCAIISNRMIPFANHRSVHKTSVSEKHPTGYLWKSRGPGYILFDENDNPEIYYLPKENRNVRS